jgi:NAD(P)-dependent dehydrogenase (short-subunit alcohol dehydrogenase family)
MSKTALIWGAGGGIGGALGRLLRAEGWQVIAVARGLNGIEEFAPLAFEADFGNPTMVQTTVTAIAQQVDTVDWWIYTAGDIVAAQVREMTPEAWRRILDANLTGVYHTVHFSLPLLSSQAPLYLLGAVNERMRLPGLSAYVAAKAGLEALAEVLRKELRRTVVVVRPAAVNTPLWNKVPFKLPSNAMTPEALAERMLQAYMQGMKDGLMDVLYS